MFNIKQREYREKKEGGEGKYFLLKLSSRKFHNPPNK